jgi:hypothetical protein
MRICVIEQIEYSHTWLRILSIARARDRKPLQILRNVMKIYKLWKPISCANNYNSVRDEEMFVKKEPSRWQLHSDFISSIGPPNEARIKSLNKSEWSVGRENRRLSPSIVVPWKDGASPRAAKTRPRSRGPLKPKPKAGAQSPRRPAAPPPHRPCPRDIGSGPPADKRASQG